MTPCSLSGDEDGVPPADRSCLKNHESDLRTAESEQTVRRNSTSRRVGASRGKPGVALLSHGVQAEFFSGVEDALAREAKRSFFFLSTRVFGVQP